MGLMAREGLYVLRYVTYNTGVTTAQFRQESMLIQPTDLVKYGAHLMTLEIAIFLNLPPAPI